MRTNTIKLQDRIDGQHKRTDVLGIPALSQGQARYAWITVGNAAMYSRIRRLEQQHKLASIRHKTGVITDTIYNRSLSRTLLRLRNIQYWQH